MITKMRIKGKAKIQAIIMALAIVVMAAVPQVNVSAAPVEVAQAALGIDVSRYQGQINWDQVAASGIQFAMIRVGYRTQNTGVLNEDPYARYNLQEAQRVGIKTGAYFFSTAVNKAEAVEEATWVCNLLDKYQITYPVAFDCEGYKNADSRQYGLDKATRTSLAITFLDTVAARGYTPMFYNYKNAMENSADWDMNTLASKYKVWVASFPAVTFPQATCNYSGIHSMWQYTQSAVIAGIGTTVDMNVAYFDYTETAAAKDASGATQVQATSAANVQFTDVYEVVTAKSTLNLRTVPSTDSADTVVVQIKNGDMIFRTGVGNNGWSKVMLPGSDQVLYAYTQYLVKVQ